MSGTYRLEAPARLDCEVLVVGSGAGGACVAEVLTGAGRDVLMIEEGPYVDHRQVPDNVARGVHELWRCGGLTAALGRPPVAYAEGRCVGGGTEINSAIFQDTPGPLLDLWARDYRIAAFGADALVPYYERAAAAVNATLTEGPLGEASELLRRGGEALGWSLRPLARGQRGCVGTNMCATGCPTGGKQSMTATLLPRALGRGLRLLAHCRVKRLRRRRGRIVGALAVARGHDGRRHRVTVACRAAVLCAGAVQTPALLRRSGFTARIGDTLRLHPTVKALALFDHEVDAHLSRLPLYAITQFMPDQRLGGSLFQPGFFGLSLAEDWDQRAWLLPHWRRTGIYYAMARARGIGRVRTLPGVAEPLVRFRLEPDDWRALAEGLRRLAELMFAAGARRVVPSIHGHPGWSDPGQAREVVERGLPAARTALMTIHLFSSCPPGEDPARCALDSFGRVRGVANLFVADGSQLPEAPGVNPQGTIMALAYRSAEAMVAAGDRTVERRAFGERGQA